MFIQSCSFCCYETYATKFLLGIGAEPKLLATLLPIQKHGMWRFVVGSGGEQVTLEMYHDTYRIIRLLPIHPNVYI